MSDVDRGCQALSEALGTLFRPLPKPKQPPKQRYRVGWWKPTKSGHARVTHSYKRFDDILDAEVFAIEHAANVEEWTPDGWRTRYRRK